MHLRVRRVFVAVHPISADHLQATPERPRLNDTSRVVAYPDVTSVRGNDLRLEFQDLAVPYRPKRAPL